MTIFAPTSAQSKNRLLASLPPDEYALLVPHLKTMPLEVKQIVGRVHATIDYVFFPLSGIISAMTVMQDGRAIEVATIGNEGMAGVTGLIGGETWPYELMVQVTGDGLRMDAAVFRERTSRDCALRRMLVDYNTAFAFQVAYAVACNGLHTVEMRCCRWLLMTRDRVGSNVVPLTHEFLAIMLGVRRASVTDVLNPLQKRGLIRNRRGEIEILDEPGLELLACECYASVNREFARLFG